MKYIFINQNSNEKGGVTTLAKHFLKFEHRSIVLNLNADFTDMRDCRVKYLSSDLSHRPQGVAKIIDSIVQITPSENFLLIPNFGQLAHYAASLSLATNKNCRILGIIHNNQSAFYDILKSFSPVISQYLAVSKFVLKKLASKVGNDKKMSVLYPLTTVSNHSSKINYKEPLKLLYVSRLTNIDKESQRLIPFIETLAKTEFKFSLDIYGDGPCRDDIQSYIDSLQLTNGNIKMHGAQPHNSIERAFSYGDIFISLSSREGFGMAIAEAMGSRIVPLVMRFEGGVCEFLKDGVDSFLVEQSDFQGLAAKLHDLDQDRKLLEKMKNKAALNIKKTQDVKLFFDSFLEIAQSCFSTKRPEVPIDKITSMDPMISYIEEIVTNITNSNHMKISIYGGGFFGRRVIDRIRDLGIEIMYIYDSCIGESKKFYQGIMYLPPSQLTDKYPIAVCSIESNAEISNLLLGKKVNPSKIIAL